MVLPIALSRSPTADATGTRRSAASCSGKIRFLTMIFTLLALALSERVLRCFPLVAGGEVNLKPASMYRSSSRMSITIEQVPLANL